MCCRNIILGLDTDEVQNVNSCPDNFIVIRSPTGISIADCSPADIPTSAQTQRRQLSTTMRRIPTVYLCWLNIL